MHSLSRRPHAAASLMACALVAACAQTAPPPAPVVAARPVSPPVTTPQQPVALAEMHRQASDLERIWHVRAALNVAALQCAGSGQANLVRDYNQLLARHKDVLAQAYAAKQARFQQAGGKSWQAAMDRHMTQLYNYWAWPPAQQAFCAAAADAARRAAGTAPDAFSSYAPRALSALDQPIALSRGSSIRLVTAPAPASAPTRLSAKQ